MRLARDSSVWSVALAIGILSIGCEIQDLMEATGSQSGGEESAEISGGDGTGSGGGSGSVPASPPVTGNPDTQSTPDPDPDPDPDPEPQPDGDPSGIAAEVHTLVNQYRRSVGLPALVWSDTVAAQCTIHSGNIASGSVPFGHDGFSARVDAIGQSISWTSAGENVAGAPTAAVAVDLWLNSPGHLANIKGDYDLAGVGVAADAAYGYIYTQIFIRL